MELLSKTISVINAGLEFRPFFVGKPLPLMRSIWDAVEIDGKKTFPSSAQPEVLPSSLLPCFPSEPPFSGLDFSSLSLPFSHLPLLGMYSPFNVQLNYIPPVFSPIVNKNNSVNNKNVSFLSVVHNRMVNAIKKAQSLSVLILKQKKESESEDISVQSASSTFTTTSELLPCTKRITNLECCPHPCAPPIRSVLPSGVIRPPLTRSFHVHVSLVIVDLLLEKPGVIIIFIFFFLVFFFFFFSFFFFITKTVDKKEFEKEKKKASISPAKVLSQSPSVDQKEFEKEKKKISTSPAKVLSQSPSVGRNPSPGLRSGFFCPSSLSETGVVSSSDNNNPHTQTVRRIDSLPPLPPDPRNIKSNSIYSPNLVRQKVSPRPSFTPPCKPPSLRRSVSSSSLKNEYYSNSIGFVELQVFDIINHTDSFSKNLPPFLESLIRQTLLGDWKACSSSLLSKYALETASRWLSTTTMSSDTYIGLIEILFIYFYFFFFTLIIIIIFFFFF
jgi:hypothetical protein